MDDQAQKDLVAREAAHSCGDVGPTMSWIRPTTTLWEALDYEWRRQERLATLWAQT